MLHITNGDAAGDTIRTCGIGGDVLPWRDPMHHGPFPPDLDLDAVSAVRSQYLDGPSHGFEARNDSLKAASRHDEVVIWFEHDLLDQLQILQLLDWFAGASLGSAKLTMICINQFPGVVPFFGLGQLNAAQMASLFPSRHPVTKAQTALAKAGWSAFRSPDPTTLERFLGNDLTPLPFLHAALARHFEEYPWSNDGLTRTERQILRLVSNGLSAPGRIFGANMNLETALFEGDLRTFQHMADLSGAAQPLLRGEPHGIFRSSSGVTMSREAMLGQRLTLTEAGRQVLTGQAAAWDLMHRDEWLGGVHLVSGQPMWTWDAGNASPRLRHFPTAARRT